MITRSELFHADRATPGIVRDIQLTRGEWREMAVYLKPCTGCPLREGCQQRDDFRGRVKGLGLRSVTFNCDRLTTSLTPGTRIVVKHPIVVKTDDGYYGPASATIYAELPATINSSGLDEFSCVIDRDALLAAIEKQGGDQSDKVDTYRFRKTMLARRIVRFLDEPKRDFCDCGHVKAIDGRCERRAGESCFATTPTVER